MAALGSRAYAAAMQDVQEFTDQAVRAAWAGLAGVARIEPLQILVRARSPLCPPGWVCLLRIENTLTVVVPVQELVPTFRAALEGQRIEAGCLEALAAQLPPVQEVLGPASLFYSLEPCPAPIEDSKVQVVQREELGDLFSVLTPAELGECGLEHVSSDLFVLRDAQGRIVSACGYELWPAQIAHLCIATAPEVRRRGAGRTVARAALAHAVTAGLLPQWRAVPEPSKRVARALGLTELGEQLSLRLL